MAAKFIVFEGLDGSGKSTLIRGVTAELTRRGQPFLVTREPGGTPLAEDIRNLLLRTDGEVPVAATELLLYTASRAQHVAEKIQPALARGEWVLCDRFAASSVAFQAFARGLPRAHVDWLNKFAQQGTAPDVNILVDVTVEESERRQAGRGEKADRMESEKRDFHQKVYEGYKAQTQEHPRDWIVAAGTMTPDQMTAWVLNELKGRGWLS